MGIFDLKEEPKTVEERLKEAEEKIICLEAQIKEAFKRSKAAQRIVEECLSADCPYMRDHIVSKGQQED